MVRAPPILDSLMVTHSERISEASRLGLLPSPDEVEIKPPARLDRNVRRMLERLFAEPHPERRDIRRYSFPLLLKLTPVNGASLVEHGDSTTVIGKDISERGIGMYHREPLPYRTAVAEFSDGCGQRTSLLVELLWCRFDRRGWYESGGRLIRVLSHEVSRG